MAKNSREVATKSGRQRRHGMTTRSLSDESVAIRKKKGSSSTKRVAKSSKSTSKASSKRSRRSRRSRRTKKVTKKGGKSTTRTRKSRRTRRVKKVAPPPSLDNAMDSEIQGLLDEHRPGLSMSPEGVAELNAFVGRVFAGVTAATSALAKSSRRKVVNEEDVQVALRNVLPLELARFHEADLEEEELEDEEVDQDMEEDEE